ncbi:hypothetical protein [Mucilaginibacter sp. UYCu711]|uniref:hypothetical protein n=1 Tax=Mucilaginibacter sp. UYCu711 TaxID=3156339 RepID=UPI003D248C7D
MKKLIVIILLLVATNSQAQYQIVTAVVKKVIKAIDLKVQRMQNQTIWLQNAQKTIENELSKFRLNEISNWSDKQKTLYDDYYKELSQVKSTITYYQRIKDLTLKQVHMVSEYQRVWNLFKSDKHFRAEEIDQMQRVYLGILDASAKNLDQIMLVINPGRTQMTDQQRLEMINQAGNRLDENYGDLKQYNNQNILLSLNRSNGLNEVQTIKNYMASIKIIIVLLLSANCAQAQTFAEWFSQKKTQKKYLLQQIAALQIYSGFLKTGYGIAKGGLSAIGNSAKSEFGLHTTYYNHLKTVSVPVKNNPQVNDILRWQHDILLRLNTIEKTTYNKKVCEALLTDCDAQLTDLQTVLTDNKVEMSDEERLRQIARIHANMQSNYRFAAKFSNDVKNINLQRQQEQIDVNTLKSLYENH